MRESGLCIRAAQDGTVLCGGRSIGVLAIRSGTEIAIDPPGSEMDSRLLRYFVLGTALRALLHQRGFLVLHASVVELAGSGVAFIGTNGAGKSTIAAAFLASGQRVLSDDIAAIDIAASAAVVYPSVPQLKLWPAVADRLCPASGDLAPLIEGDVKLAWRNPTGWCNEPVPLTHVYELAPGPANVTCSLEPHHAVEALLRNSYSSKLGLLVDPKATTVHLAQCLRVVGKASVRTFTVRRDLDRVDETIRTILSDCKWV
jgi:hypothetical protein